MAGFHIGGWAHAFELHRGNDLHLCLLCNVQRWSWRWCFRQQRTDKGRIHNAWLHPWFVLVVDLPHNVAQFLPKKDKTSPLLGNQPCRWLDNNTVRYLYNNFHVCGNHITHIQHISEYFVPLQCKKQIIMSKDEINKYRLTDMEEPSDEMLEYIMHEVAEEAKKQYNIAIEKYFLEMTEMYRKQYGNGELQQ